MKYELPHTEWKLTKTSEQWEGDWITTMDGYEDYQLQEAFEAGIKAAAIICEIQTDLSNGCSSNYP